MKSRLSDVPAAIRLSRAVLRNIHENLFWAFFYNVIGIPLAAGAFTAALGWKLNPMFGAAAMSLSSFCVVTNALRLNLFKMYTRHTERKSVDSVQEFSENEKEKNEEKEKTMNEKTLKIEGMMCEHCEMHVKKALEALDGVESASASHEQKCAKVTLKPGASVSDEAFKAAVSDAGYELKEVC